MLFRDAFALRGPVMPFEKLVQMSGNPHVHNVKGTPFEHCHNTDVIANGIVKATKGVATALTGKKQ